MIEIICISYKSDNNVLLCWIHFNKELSIMDLLIIFGSEFSTQS